MRGLFLDFEASDKDVKTARITQLALSIFDLNEARELFHYSTLVKPDGDYEINEVAAKITGITKEQLEVYGIPVAEALSALLFRFSSVDYIIAHNLHNFDLPLLKNECERAKLRFFHPELIDTRFDIPWPEHIETRKLTYLGAEHGVVNPSAHSARHDVDIMCKLFFMYPLEQILERARSPRYWIRANVSYDNKDKAKDKKFMWDAKNKIWVKQFKECDLEKETFDFQITKMNPEYQGP